MGALAKFVQPQAFAANVEACRERALNQPFCPPVDYARNLAHQSGRSAVEVALWTEVERKLRLELGQRATDPPPAARSIDWFDNPHSVT